MSYGKAQSRGIKGDFSSLANVRHLTRIITYLSEVEKDYIKNISINAGVTSGKIKSAMVFLVNNGIVLKERGATKEKKRITSVWYYSLNKKFIEK